MLLVSSGCSDSTGVDKGSPIGAYELSTINGRPLPFVLISFLNAYKLEHVSGQMTLNVDKTFLERETLRETIALDNGNSQVTDTTVVLDGRWEQQDSALFLVTNQDGSVLFGFFSGGRLVLNYEATSDSVYSFVYLKKNK